MYRQVVIALIVLQLGLLTTAFHKDFMFEPWGTWSSCSGECGYGLRVRSRDCNHHGHWLNGYCTSGCLTDVEKCSLTPCPIDGGFTQWTAFTPCSAKCGIGHRKRERECTNPTPAFGGKPCCGPTVEEVECFERPCLNDGQCVDEVPKCSEWAKLGFCALKRVKDGCSHSCGTCLASRV